MTNPRIRGWLEEGDEVEALLGRAGHFVLDRHWGDHDSLLVLSELVAWADESDRRTMVAPAVVDAVDRAARSGDAGAALGIVRAWAIVRDRTPWLAVDPTALVDAVVRLDHLDLDAHREQVPVAADDLGVRVEQIWSGPPCSTCTGGPGTPEWQRWVERIAVDDTGRSLLRCGLCGTGHVVDESGAVARRVAREQFSAEAVSWLH